MKMKTSFTRKVTPPESDMPMESEAPETSTTESEASPSEPEGDQEVTPSIVLEGDAAKQLQNEYKDGDTVTFTATGTISHSADGTCEIAVSDIETSGGGQSQGSTDEDGAAFDEAFAKK